MIPLDTGEPEWPQRAPGDFWRNSKGQPMVARLRKRQGVKADLLAAAEAEGVDVPDKVTVADLHELLGPEPGARLEHDRPSHWPFDDWTGIDIKYANRGTLAHDLTEWLDKGGSPEAIPDEMIERAVALEVGEELLTFIAHDWVRFRVEHGLRPTFIECTVVNDELMVAGTADEFCTATIPIVTPFGTVEPGDLVALDKKTSDDCVRPGYVVQLARYANAVPYDTDTDLRGEWPQPINKRIGFFAQFRMSSAIDGEPTRWELVPADIAAGYEIAQEVHRLKNLDVSAAFGDPIAPPSSSPEVEAPAGGDATHGSEPSPPATLDEWRTAFDTWEPLKREAFAEYRFNHGITKDATDAERLAAYEDFHRTHHFHDVATQAPSKPVTPPKPEALPVVVDEGDDITEGDLWAAGKRYGDLPKFTRSWVTVTGSRVRLSPAHGGRPSVRRFELLRGLCALAEAGFDNDDMVRAIAHHILGDIVWQGAPAAAVVAALDLDEAARFARMCDALAGAADVSLRYTDDGRAVLEPSLLDAA